MAVVAQLVEPRVVISVVVGSSPISRPNFYSSLSSLYNYPCYTSLFKTTTLAIFGNFLRLGFGDGDDKIMMFFFE